MKVVNLSIIKRSLSRTLPKSWGAVDDNDSKYSLDGLSELGEYCSKLYNSLLSIREHYQAEFDRDNNYKIDDYIALYDSVFDNIRKILVKGDIYDKEKKYCDERNLYFNENNRFELIKSQEKLNDRLFEYNKFGKIAGFNNETYLKLEPLVKNLFLIEKMCSFTTRKFWANLVTPVSKLDLNKQFKMLVKIVVPGGWRNQIVTPEVSKYYSEKVYQSASLIDDEHIYNLIAYWEGKVCAGLILDFDANDVVFANGMDAYSEEEIDGRNPNLQKSKYTELFKIDLRKRNNKVHTLFADAVETETPKSIMQHLYDYNEVGLKKAKVVGIYAPNKNSLSYAKQLAKEYKVKIFSKSDD